MKKKDRVRRVKDKYGENAFKEWGRRGGSPLLTPKVVRAYKEGKLIIKK